MMLLVLFKVKNNLSGNCNKKEDTFDKSYVFILPLNKAAFKQGILQYTMTQLAKKGQFLLELNR